jgi:Bacterial archaeo-eukaryotic release factor family 10
MAVAGLRRPVTARGKNVWRPMMIGPADVEKLRAICAPEPAVLSLYLPVPLDPAELRELPARADDLIASATAGGPLPGADRDALDELVAARGREWLGHTVAIFVCGELGLLEALPLPGQVGERAVLATRPHVRPILATLQRNPAYLATVIDRQHGWLLSIAGDDVETIEALAAPGVRSARFGGWYGLESYRVQQRVTELARHHYRDVVTILAREARAGGDRPLVIGGQPEAVAQLLGLLPEHLRAQYAGSFTADPHTLTAARVRELAGPVLANWAARHEQQLMADRMQRTDTVTGIPACLAAVNSGAAGLLLIPDEELIPGFVCGRCDAISLTGDDCPDWGVAARAVPDVLEEMAARVLDHQGRVVALHEPPWAAAAQLRFPVPTMQVPRA